MGFRVRGLGFRGLGLGANCWVASGGFRKTFRASGLGFRVHGKALLSRSGLDLLLQKFRRGGGFCVRCYGMVCL